VIVLLGEVGGQFIPYFVGDTGGELLNLFPDRLMRCDGWLLADGGWRRHRLLLELAEQQACGLGHRVVD
jgi:hypothetical protein